LRCVECGSTLALVEVITPGGYPDLGPDGRLECTTCDALYPIIAGTVRALPRDQMADLWRYYPKAATALEQTVPRHAVSSMDGLQRRTVDGFAYEWEHFGRYRDHWRKNFLDYMYPFPETWFRGKLLVDAGAGSGRHSFQASQLGANVIAVDLGRAIDVARRNLPASVLTVQADVNRLPLARHDFDMVACIGVLPVVPNPEETFRRLVPFARPGGHVHIYTYWIPSHRWHRGVLKGVTAVRRITVRLPYRLLHALCVPLAALLYLIFVLPYRLARSYSFLRGLAETFPLKTYADYPFGVCVNDQFDRLSAPIEHRHTAGEIRAWFECAGFDEVIVHPNHGWVGNGILRPTSARPEA
jgi:2-polyprenyl-3-methyl-5-hydroxy-6-metoxy-1,4-benzoquinol methylase